MFKVKNISKQKRKFRDTHSGKTIILESGEDYLAHSNLKLGPEFDVYELEETIKKNINTKDEKSNVDKEE